MANTTRKKRRRSPFVRTILRLFFILLLLSMLVAYISNQVSISSRRAELQTLNEQIEQQQSQHMHTEQRCRRVEQNGQPQQEFLADDRHDEFCDFPQRGVADDRPIGLEQEKGDERIYDRAANP